MAEYQRPTRSFDGTQTSDEKRSMPVEVVLRRFFRDVQQSEIMTEIKRRRFFEKKPTRFKRLQSSQARSIRLTALLTY